MKPSARAAVEYLSVKFVVLTFLTAALSYAAQPPVVLINGYQFSCLLSNGVTSSFGGLQQLLSAAGIPSAFYDTCSCERCAIEEHGARVGSLIQSMKNSDGTPATQVDVIAASMGGLILRSYLTGKKANARSFTPPDDPKVRKAVFIATPHFGLIAPELDDNLTDMQLGSRLTWELATWNQNSDDLRGIDAIAVAGNGGNKTGDSLDDGLVPLTSAALSFAATSVSDPSRTRVVPYCHTTDIPFVVQCKSGAAGLAKIDSFNNPVFRIIRSFLTGTNDWTTIGESAATNAVLSKNGALVTNAHDAADREIRPAFVVATGQSNTSTKYNLSSNTSNVKLIMDIAAPAVPGSAEAVKQAGRTDVKVIGLSLPNMCKPYVHSGIVQAVVLWNTLDLGYLTVLAADALASGKLKPGDKFIDAGRLGKIQIEGDEVMLGKPFVFTKVNIDKFDF